MKLNTKLTLLQLSSSSRKSRILKQPVYFSLLINGFNLKIQTDTTIVEGLDKANKNKP